MKRKRANIEHLFPQLRRFIKADVIPSTIITAKSAKDAKATITADGFRSLYQPLWRIDTMIPAVFKYKHSIKSLE